MVMAEHIQERVEDFLQSRLEDGDFTSVLEEFDLTPEEVFWILFEAGMLDESLIFEGSPWEDDA